MKKMPLSIFLWDRNDSPDADASSPHAIAVKPDLGAPGNHVASPLANMAASPKSPAVFYDAASGNPYIHHETAVWGTTAA